MRATRRGVFAGSAAVLGAPVAASAAPVATPRQDDLARRADAYLQPYIGFGDKASGGAGDNAAGAWMEAALKAYGFTAQRQTFSAPFFEPTSARLTSRTAHGPLSAPVRPQAIVQLTGPEGVAGLLTLCEPYAVPPDLKGRIALIPLPFGRWSTAVTPAVQAPVKAALAAGAVAVVLVTNGPTGEAVALNADGRAPMFDRPVALLAPKDAGPLLRVATAAPEAWLTVTGQGGRREAYNLVGRLKRNDGGWLVVSTPRSGWGVCAGERGGGIAVWMMLAEWAAASLKLNLAFTSNSGHEYENLGAEHALEGFLPKPAETRLWVHLGANVAARDWHEIGGRLLPLPSADPQRVLMASPALLPRAKAAFAGLPGLEAVYPTAAGAPGELGPILAAGYANVVGAFGSHRFHHCASDDARCVSAPLVADAYLAFRQLIQTTVG
jgi:hypothetical protein